MQAPPHPASSVARPSCLRPKLASAAAVSLPVHGGCTQGGWYLACAALMACAHQYVFTTYARHRSNKGKKAAASEGAEGGSAATQLQVESLLHMYLHFAITWSSMVRAASTFLLHAFLTIPPHSATPMPKSCMTQARCSLWGVHIGAGRGQQAAGWSSSDRLVSRRAQQRSHAGPQAGEVVCKNQLELASG